MTGQRYGPEAVRQRRLASPPYALLTARDNPSTASILVNNFFSPPAADLPGCAVEPRPLPSIEQIIFDLRVDVLPVLPLKELLQHRLDAVPVKLNHLLQEHLIRRDFFLEVVQVDQTPVGKVFCIRKTLSLL